MAFSTIVVDKVLPLLGRRRSHKVHLQIARLKYSYMIPNTLWSRVILVLFCWCLILLLRALAGVGSLEDKACVHVAGRHFLPRMQQEYSPDRGLIVRTPRAQIPDSATRKAADWYKDDLDISHFAIAPQDAFPTPTTQKMRTLTRSSSPTPSHFGASVIGIPPAYSPPQYIYYPFDLDSFNTAVYDARINLSRFPPDLDGKPLNDSAFRRRPRKRRYSRQD